MDDILNIYTDGSCDNLSPKREGGAAYIVVKCGEVIHKDSKGFFDTSNNRMELIAILSGVNYVPDGSRVRIYTDSKYCIGVLINRTKVQKCNMDLISKYRSISRKLKSIEFVWVRGHSGHKYNEMADEMAKIEYTKMKNHAN